MNEDESTANLVDGVPERFVPSEMSGTLEEAEHLARYGFATAYAAGRRTLDAGCGVGYGTAMLAAAGATSVVGIDIADAVLTAAGAKAPAGLDVEFQRGDVRELPFEDGSFDLVACFEVIEHVERQEDAIAEMHRVLAPDGLLVISSPNRGVYVEGNPHHVHEYTSEEFRGALAQRFAHVQLVRQHDWIVSAVLGDADFASDDPTREIGLAMTKAVGAQPGAETYTVALASDGPLPSLRQYGVATGAVELHRWLGLYADQQKILEGQRVHAENVRSLAEERNALRLRLEQTEEEIATLLEGSRDAARMRGTLESRLEDAARDAAVQAADADEAQRRITELAGRVERADRVLRAVQASPSWTITAPLRSAKRRLRS
jgi:SAM-dependent methyltransferase